MAFTPFPKLSLLGFQAQGDLAGFTLYTDQRNQLVAFVKSPPLEPPSWRQIVMRNRFRHVAARWQTLNTTEKNKWETATKKTSLKLNGYALYTYLITTGDRRAIATVERNAATSLATGD